MDRQQEFWATLKQKYEDKNRALEQREQELRLKLEAMETIVGMNRSDKISAHTSMSRVDPFSCTCQSQERAGFFRGLFSMFGSTKPKPEPPPSQGSPSVPQEIPTRDQKTIGGRPENCLCNPCQFFESQTMPQKRSANSGTTDSCNCSICTRSDGSKHSSTKEDTCSCSICSRLSENKPKVTNFEELCLCNPTDLQMDPNLAQSPQIVGLTGSKVSLKSLDLFYMKNIHELANQQNDLVKHIADLEQKNQIYENVFNEYKTVDFGKKDKCICNEPTGSDPNEKTIAELKLENFLLKNELKDMRLEVRQYLERMEGPMQFKIESERYKCLQLEQKLEDAAKEMAQVQEFYQKEINSLKMQLCTATTTVYNLTSVNEQLTKDVEAALAKCAKLEDDLIRQKISEAETIKSLQVALMNAKASCTAVKEECNLHQIARDLSNILKECEPCGDCLTLPEDLMAAATMLKNLTDVVDSKLKGTQDDLALVPTSEPQMEFPPMELPPEVLNLQVVQETEMAQKHQELNLTVEAEVTDKVSEKPSVQISEQPQELLAIEPPAVEEASNKSQPEATASERSAPANLEQTEATPKSSVLSSSTPKTSTKVDQLWPKTDQPVQLKDSGEIVEKPKKGKCPCSLFKRTKEEQKETVKSRKSDCRGKKPISEKKPCKCSQPKEVKQEISETTSDKKSCKCSQPREVKQEVIRETASDKKLCKCGQPKELKQEVISDTKLCKCGQPKEVKEEPKPLEVAKVPPPVDQLWPKPSDRLTLSHHVTASKSKDLLKSETNVKCLKVKENFPFDVDTQVDIIPKAPDGVHVTTTITNSGTLEVITEGPEGVIETTLIYTNSGNVEVVTEILEYQGKGIVCKKKAIEGPKTCASEPGKILEAITAANIESTQSGPALINPNCQCSKCPGKELLEKEAENQEEKTAEAPVAELTIEQTLEKFENFVEPPEEVKEIEVQEETQAEEKKSDENAVEQAEEKKSDENAVEQLNVAEPTVEEPVEVAENQPAEEVQEEMPPDETIPPAVEQAAEEAVEEAEAVAALSFSMHVESETNFPQIEPEQNEENQE